MNQSLEPNDLRHGTANAYKNLGCRCAPCREANNAHNRRVKERARERGLESDDPRHGTRHAYDTFKCRCKPCVEAQKRHSRKTLYGLDKVTEVAFQAATHCEICLGVFDEKIIKAVDHSHKTGKVRGFICRRCNTALGMLDDSIESARRLTAYLIRHAEQEQ